ncbi:MULTISPECIES: PstS family phosphate ABC transporter substrate-binding protein [Psychrilyobacter]|uniref:Phosphate-binding protein n=1 Tax=Psychrilyobacter piezotolerans TaxID=2293438 RepID=A0ABX9KEY4_9FUSO|nr:MULTISPECIES: PstS family phosphate ABC transporter substrate-binding protein [Psychrilyobacter]MCS5421946.1 PstS family phosphate ABC transporter substrate-binding protein [Psychrilyobacter sp. S5]NDI78964.1 PstS family phosphate ABC transporter substrate-binding protein [Psychrilyobacter piezotolerans]RDE59256.1 phosphate ABC transporter substrate-binding protein PstS family protein [Psychrilyobacter sp. S5]REI39816.1 phosphate ABC transporter substrate-binding protein PstS family protein 
MLKKILLGASLLLLVACGEGKTKSEVIKLQGSDTILNTSQAISEEFMKENKEARIAVTGGGSGTGIAAKLNGTVHIAMASRSIKDKELEKAKEVGIDLEEIVLGFDGITVITNHDNKIENLDRAVLGKVFAGEITNWNELGGDDAEIVVLSRDSSSGTHSYFKEAIVRNGDKKSEKEYGKKTLYMPSNQAILQEVKNNKYALGYIGMGYMEDSVKALSVDNVEPSFKNVADKSYPIAREVYWYVDADRKGDAAKLVEFALSPKGQEIVKSEGFVPAK